MRTRVAIIGGGPAGLLLALRLARAGIEAVVLERRSRAHVLSRIRAGVLEWGTVATLRNAGLGAVMDCEGDIHAGVALGFANRQFRIDFADLCQRSVMVWGQTEVTRQLYEALDRLGATILHDAEDVALHDVTAAPRVTFVRHGEAVELRADIIAGCDGFHGVSRRTIPSASRTELERHYPFGWLGVLSKTPPVSHELIYANHPRGFALASMRNARLSRYYIQVPADERVEDWSASAFWDELRRRLPDAAAQALVCGPPVEMSVAPLRSFVCEPMRWGRLFLAGDAAHIVPPTGAKGLNLALSDVTLLADAIIAHDAGDRDALEAYSGLALARIWRAIRFSWWMTTMLHRFPDQSAFDQRIQEAELGEIERSPAARKALAEVYTGLY